MELLRSSSLRARLVHFTGTSPLWPFCRRRQLLRGYAFSLTRETQPRKPRFTPRPSTFLRRNIGKTIYLPTHRASDCLCPGGKVLAIQRPATLRHPRTPNALNKLEHHNCRRMNRFGIAIGQGPLLKLPWNCPIQLSKACELQRLPGTANVCI